MWDSLRESGGSLDAGLMSRSTLIIKHSSRAAKIARFDRYSLIHKFFTRPLSPAQVTRPTDSSLFSPSLRLNFHSSCRVRDNRSPPNTAPRIPNSEPQGPLRQSTPIDHHNSHLNSTSIDNNYPAFFRRLAKSLPHVSRPSRDDFLHVANGFVQRMRVRVRWFFIRNFRKFNADDISAFVTWFLVGQGLWILIGTLVVSALFPS
jgi:mitochondrial distribution and morphology protein 31